MVLSLQLQEKKEREDGTGEGVCWAEEERGEKEMPDLSETESGDSDEVAFSMHPSYPQSAAGAPAHQAPAASPVQAGSGQLQRLGWGHGGAEWRYILKAVCAEGAQTRLWLSPSRMHTWTRTLAGPGKQVEGQLGANQGNLFHVPV